MSLDDSKFYHVHKCNTAKEIWDTLDMIYRVSPSIELEKMNPRGEDDEYTTFECF